VEIPDCYPPMLKEACLNPCELGYGMNLYGELYYLVKAQPIDEKWVRLIIKEKRIHHDENTVVTMNEVDTLLECVGFIGRLQLAGPQLLNRKERRK
jgi:hypothetical protein